MTTVRRLFDGLQVAPVAAEEPADRRVWNKLIPLGTYHRPDFPDGKLTFDKGFLETMVANFRKAGRRLPLDYFHRGASSPDGQSTDAKVASGWIHDLEVRADGLWMSNTWTPRARGYIAAGELQYLSPTFHENALDRTTGKKQGPTLFGAALLNDPFLEQLPPVAASAVQPQAATTAATGARMDKAKLCAALGLSAELSDDEVMAKAAEMLAESKKLSAELEKRTLAATDEGRALAAVQTTLKAKAEEVTKLSARVDEQAKELAAIKTERRDADVQALVDQLMAEQRIDSKDQESVKEYALSLGLEKARTFFGGLPQRRVPGEIGHSGKPTGTTDQMRDAEQKLRTRRTELMKTGASFNDAHALARSEMKAESELLYGVAP